MFQPFKDRQQYAKLKQQQMAKAELQGQELDSSPEEFLVELFDRLQLSSLGGVMAGNRRTEIRTPAKLKPLVEELLCLPSELSAWLVLYKAGHALQRSNLPLELRGDIMMAFEVGNYMLPEKIKGVARHLACALCIMPSLSDARATLMNLGVPFQEDGLSQDYVQALIRQGLLPSTVVSSQNGLTKLGWNLELREAVANELQTIVPNASALFQLSMMHKIEHQELRRLATNPKREADELLERALQEPDLHKAFDMYTEVGTIDAILLPDVYRNQAWILAKWGRYADAIPVCHRALEIDPGYEDVWYHLGICLAKQREFTDALAAFEKAKSLGLRKPGLETNIATCKRAIAAGMR